MSYLTISNSIEFLQNCSLNDNGKKWVISVAIFVQSKYDNYESSEYTRNDLVLEENM